MTNEMYSDLFETIQLPILIMNLKVPELRIIDTDGKERGFYFRRNGSTTILYKRAMDILLKHNRADEICTFLFDTAKVEKLLLGDDTGIVMRIQDRMDKTGKREFVRVRYFDFTESINAELKTLFAGYPLVTECYAASDGRNYYLFSPQDLQENDGLMAAIMEILKKHLPQGVDFGLGKIPEGTPKDEIYIGTDCEKIK